MQQQKEKRILKNKNSLRDRWENFKHTNSCIIGAPEEGQELEKELKTCLKNDGKLPLPGEENRHKSSGSIDSP